MLILHRLQIIQNCKQTLKEYEIPKYFIILKELPYTQNGKYDFRKLEVLGEEYVSSLSDNKSLNKIKKKI